MGKEWLQWGGDATRKRGRWPKGEGDMQPSGCMCSVFQLFDLHQFQVPLNSQSSFKPDFSYLPEEPTELQGVAAPRNSLELENPFMETASLSSTNKGRGSLNIQMGMQIKTRGPKSRADDLSTECSSSPGTKTPNLVARLMGLDLLPEGSSPSSSSSYSKSSSRSGQLRSLKQGNRASGLLGRSSALRHDSAGTRSLPETPRISSARKSDVDHHRLSLQISRESVGGNTMGEDLEFSSYLRCKVARRREDRREDENRSPGHYAKQIMKKMKENVLSRKVGLDITNTIHNRAREKEDLIVLLRSKKQPNGELTRVGGDHSRTNQSIPSCSPRLPLLSTELKDNIKNQTCPAVKLSPLSSSVEKASQSERAQSRPKCQEPAALKHQRPQQKNSAPKCKNVSNENFNKNHPRTSADIVRNKHEEQFVRSPTTNKAKSLDRKGKRAPLLSTKELLNSNSQTPFPRKKDPSFPSKKLPPGPPLKKVSETLIPRRSNTQLPCCSSHSYSPQPTRTAGIPGATSTPLIGRNNPAWTSGGYQYIAGILESTGVGRDSHCHPLSHPLDPSIFLRLELSYPGRTVSTDVDPTRLTPMSNRKLIFDLVDEILPDIVFTRRLNCNPWASPLPFRIDTSELIDTLCSRIGSFPSADCRFLEDIDALVDKDLCRTRRRGSVACEEEEREGIANEIERLIVEALLQETAVEMRHVRGV